jgi:hypothetical protein
VEGCLEVSFGAHCIRLHSSPCAECQARRDCAELRLPVYGPGAHSDEVDHSDLLSITIPK